MDAYLAQITQLTIFKISKKKEKKKFISLCFRKQVTDVSAFADTAINLSFLLVLREKIIALYSFYSSRIAGAITAFCSDLQGAAVTFAFSRS